jgi:hypothetical protein
MRPTLTLQYAPNRPAVDAESAGQYTLGALFISPSVRSTYLSYHLLRQLGTSTRLAAHHRKSTPRNRVGNIVGVRTFGNVTRVDTRRVVAGMTCERCRPATVCQKKYKAASSDCFIFKPNTPITVGVKREFPRQALIGVVVVDGINERLVSGTIELHRRSPIARVLRRVRCH